MSSPFSHALRKLDDSLQTIQARLDCLGAALEADDDQLSHSLTDAGQHAAILRDLIRAERPDANWSDRRSLEQLIHELETSAEASRQQQRRTKLLELANELGAGRVKHRIGRRTTELETLRLKAVKELRTEAAVSEPVKDLPGPPASEWLHWACSLKDALDASVLINLRRDFAAADRFAGEMVERYWIPGQGVDERPRQASEPSLRPAEERAAESPASPSSQPVAPAGTGQDELAQNVTAQSDEAVQRGNHVEAFLLSSERRSRKAASALETVGRSEAASHWQSPIAAEASDPSDSQTVATPPMKYCDQCRSSYPNEFQVCPIDNSALRVTSESIPQKTTRGKDLLDKVDERGMRVPAGGAAHFSSPLPMGTVPSFEPAVLQPAERPSFDSSRKSAYPEFEELAAAVQRRRSAADEPFWSFAEPVPHKRQLFPWVGAVSIVVLGGIFAVLYGFNAPTSSRPHPTVATAGAKTYRAVKHSAIQKDRKRLAVVKGSSIQVTVRERLVPLLALSSPKQDLLETETLASAASGVKVVSNEIQVEARNPYPPASSAKSPEQDVRSNPSPPETATVPSAEPAQEIDRAAVQSLISAGKQAAENGEYEPAIVSYQEALRADPHNTDALAGLRSAQQAKLSRVE